MKTFAAAVFTGVNLWHLVAASGTQGSCEAEDAQPPATGDAMMQRTSQKTVTDVEEEEAGELYEAGSLYESDLGWPDCSAWTDAKIDSEIAKEKATLPQKEANTKACLDGFGIKIYWAKKKVEYVKKCLRIRFGTYGMFAEDGVSEGGAALVEGGAVESMEFDKAEVAVAESQGWPKWNELTEPQGIKIVKETEAMIKKDTKFRADVCHLGPYWAKKKIAYFENCRPDDDEERKQREKR